MQAVAPGAKIAFTARCGQAKGLVSLGSARRAGRADARGFAWPCQM